MMRLRGFIGGAYTLPSVAVECQRCVNLFPEVDESKQAANGEVGYLQRIHGNKPHLCLSYAPVRGMHRASNGVLYVVGGSRLYELKATNDLIDRGALDTSTGPVSITDNGIHLVFVDGTYGYTYKFGAASLVKITSGGFYAGPTVEFLNGLAIVPRSGTAEYHWSDLYDGTKWNALDYASASGSPDLLMTARAYNKQLWCLGTDSLEIHQHTGTSFEPISGAHWPIGCASPHCVQIVANAILWLDSSINGYGIVWMSKGMTPERISTHAIEKALQANSDLSGAYAWSYQDGGHAFYCLTIPYSKSTWCYDLSTGQWHERVSIDSHNREQPCRIACHAFAYNRHFVGDAETGCVYTMDPDYHFDGTDPIVWKRSSPHINQGMERLFHRSFELDADMGIGLDDGGIWIDKGTPQTFGSVTDVVLPGATGTTFTFVDVAGHTATPTNAPTIYRTDWQGKQLLYTTARTNLLSYSEQIDNAWWTKSQCSATPNAATAPNGSATADRVTEDTAASTTHWVRRTLSLTAGTRYTTSVYSKAGERTAVWVRAGAGSAFFNLATGTIITTLGTGATGGIEALPNGWYRCWCSCVAPTTESNYAGFGLMNGTAAANNSYTGDGGSGAFFWGAQFETGVDAPTSYIPTTSAAATLTDYTVSGSTLNLAEAAAARSIEASYSYVTNWVQIGADPQAFLRYSDDRGHSWSDLHARSLGRIGEYRKRAVWTRLGSSRDRVYEVSGSDPVPTTILGAEVK